MQKTIFEFIWPVNFFIVSQRTFCFSRFYCVDFFAFFFFTAKVSLTRYYTKNEPNFPRVVSFVWNRYRHTYFKIALSSFVVITIKIQNGSKIKLKQTLKHTIQTLGESILLISNLLQRQNLERVLFIHTPFFLVKRTLIGENRPYSIQTKFKPWS